MIGSIINMCFNDHTYFSCPDEDTAFGKQDKNVVGIKRRCRTWNLKNITT